MSAGSVRCLLLRAGWRLSAGVCETCQLITVDWRLSTSGCVICQLLEAGWRLSPGCVYAVSYLRQVGGCLQGVCTLSAVPEAARWLSASYMRQVVCCLQECVRTLSDN
jgi:hypothetical protein